MIIFSILYLLSCMYGVIVYLRNKMYDAKLIPIVRIDKKVISIGNISWGGSGKSSFVSIAHTYLAQKYRVATITKGYARDEYIMLKELLTEVHDGHNRKELLRRLAGCYDIFILDDGFQYRGLHRDLDIVIMGKKEFAHKPYLIPASLFREPRGSLKRAHIVILTYFSKSEPIDTIKKSLHAINPALSLYTGQYLLRGLYTVGKESVSLDSVRQKKCAVLTAIGHPQGFIDLLNQHDIICKKTILYPDHHEFSAEEIKSIESECIREGITTILITHKDVFHLDVRTSELEYCVVRADLEIENKESLFRDVERILNVPTKEDKGNV